MSNAISNINASKIYSGIYQKYNGIPHNGHTLIAQYDEEHLHKTVTSILKTPKYHRTGFNYIV